MACGYVEAKSPALMKMQAGPNTYRDRLGLYHYVTERKGGRRGKDTSVVVQVSYTERWERQIWTKACWKHEEMSEKLQWAGSACISVIVKTHKINCMCTRKCVTNDFKHINIWTALVLFLPREDIWELSSSSLAVDQMTKTELRVVRVEKAWNLKKWRSGDLCARHHKTVSCRIVVFLRACLSKMKQRSVCNNISRHRLSFIVFSNV